MEEIVDFDLFLQNFQLPEVTYSATFNPESGEVISVGPSHVFVDEPHKVLVDQEIAESIIIGKIPIGSCFVDITGNTLEIAEIKSMFKIDDVLHRISEKKWSLIESPEIHITYSKKKKDLTVQLTELYNGTKKLSGKTQSHKKRKVVWSGDTVMNLLVTEYNDPNVLYTMLSFTVNDLIEKKKVFSNIELPEKFSIYTRRIFKNYIMEIK
jgi:hypothetical protein